MKECPNCGKCLDDRFLICPSDNSPLSESLAGPCLIDKKYLLERCLGKGGMGSVYLVKHVELQKYFALKLILHSGLQDPAYLARFRTEARALGKLQHPNIVQVTDYGIDARNGWIPYLVMEYLEGETLLHRLETKGAMNIEQAIPLLESVASAIDYAHASGILHRDLNLKNVFLIRETHLRTQVKILDFGLARIAGAHLVQEEKVIPQQPGPSRSHKQREGETQTLIIEENLSDEGLSQPSVITSDLAVMERMTQAGTIMGTPGYIAPEIFKGKETSEASDIYSFGVLVYEILVGHKPFKDYLALSEEPRPLPLPSVEQPAIPEELNQAILAPLQPNPRLRPKKAMDVVHKLQETYAAYKYRLWRIREIPKRIRLGGVVALFFLLLFLMLPGIPFIKNIENELGDLRFQLAPLHPPDERILLVSVDEASLEADPKLLAEKADEMGLLLEKVFEAGARGIGIDFLLPERWGQSENISRLILKNQGRLILASYIKEDGSLMGMECIKGLIMAALESVERAEGLFGFINMQTDPDGYVRRAQTVLQNNSGKKMYSLIAQTFQVLTDSPISEAWTEGAVRIDFSTDQRKIQKIPWKELSSALEEQPELFKGKIVLVGGEYEGSQDFHKIPKRAGLNNEVSGLLLQALILNTLLEDKLIKDSRGFFIALPLAAIFLCFSIIFLIRPKIFSFVIILFLTMAGYLVSSYLLFAWKRQWLPVALPVLATFLAFVPVFWIRRRLQFVKKPLREVLKK